MRDLMRTAGLVLTLALVLWIALPACADEDAIFVTQVRGKVTRNGVPVKVFTYVNAGDLLRVGEGSRVLFFFAEDCHQEAVRGKTAFTVTKSGTNADPAFMVYTPAPKASLVRQGPTLWDFNFRPVVP